MEKEALLGSSQCHPPKPQRGRHLTWPIILALCIAASLVRHFFVSPIGLPKHDASPSPQFTWATTPAKPHLEYTSCYGSFQCARLQLPMDYFNGTTDASVGLAVIRMPAKVNVTHPQYGGAVLLNPGGPGGSGVAFLRGLGANIRDVIDTNITNAFAGRGKYFDLISFDPRSVGETTPGVSCTEDPQVSVMWQIRLMEEGIMGSSDASVGRLWSMAQARGGSCSLPPTDGTPDMKRYASTASTAKDMLSIVEAHGEWREKEAKRLLDIAPPGKNPRNRIEVPGRIRWNRGAEKLQYWGFSYGTYLGMTFAAMFPDRVERLAVDGVVDPYDYRKTLWYDNLIDTEKDMDEFYENCARVGYPTCALANETSVQRTTTKEGVRARADNITKSLYHNPLPVIGDNPEVITYSDVKNLIFSGLYSPIDSFPFIANVLADIEKGNGTRFAQLLKASHTPPCSAPPEDSHALAPSPEIIKSLWSFSGPSGVSLSSDALMIVSCTDGDSQANFTKEDFEKHLQKEIKLSPSIGAMWSTVRMECAHFSVRAHHRFTAPFQGNTSHPLLFIGNTADPVTPVRNAIKMAKAYPGAGVLVQDSPGHCSLSSASRCTAKHVKEYFQTGRVVPGKGTFCGVDEVPFGYTTSEKEEDDGGIVEAVTEV